MPVSSAIDPATINAYARTLYLVAVEPVLVLRVDTFSPELAALHARHGCSISAYLTACNPHSRPSDAGVNAQRQEQLAQDLQARSWRYLDGQGRDPSGAWPAEASFLILGPDRAAVDALARKYEQNAYLWSAADAIPRLILLR